MQFSAFFVARVSWFRCLSSLVMHQVVTIDWELQEVNRYIKYSHVVYTTAYFLLNNV